MRPNPHPFTLRQLQYAVAVADTLSFRKAAERCRVAQPSLSAQLAQLEDALGTQLFERDRKRVLVSPAGAALLDRARAVLREADDLVDVARRASDPLAGSLRLGVIPTIAPYLVPRLRAPLRAAHPSLSVRWIEGKTHELVAELESGGLDAALLALEANLGPVEHAHVADDPFELAAPRGHALAGSATPVTRRELGEADVLLLDEGHCFRTQALAYCATTKARELEFRATSLATLVQMVADGAGVTLLPRLAIPTESRRAELALRPLANPVPKRTIVLAWRRRSPLASALRTLTATMRAPCEVLLAEASATSTTSAPRPRRPRAAASSRRRG
jgi:LysR family hydrogen peroxide-inducible transcriptional activator